MTQTWKAGEGSNLGVLIRTGTKAASHIEKGAGDHGSMGFHWPRSRYPPSCLPEHSSDALISCEELRSGSPQAPENTCSRHSVGTGLVSHGGEEAFQRQRGWLLRLNGVWEVEVGEDTAGRALRRAFQAEGPVRAKAACTRAGGERAATGRGGRTERLLEPDPGCSVKGNTVGARLEDASEDALRAWSSPLQTTPGPGPKAVVC